MVKKNFIFLKKNIQFLGSSCAAPACDDSEGADTDMTEVEVPRAAEVLQNIHAQRHQLEREQSEKYV